MKTKVLLFVFLILFIPASAMSGGVNTDTKIENNKASLTEITNVAINYYRNTMVPRQIEKGIVTDYDKAIDLKNIKFDIDSLVIESLTVSYFFNFYPTGVVNVRATKALGPVAMSAEKGKVDVMGAYLHRNDPGVIPTTKFNKDNHIFKSFYKRPTNDAIEKWKKYNVDPKDFKVKKNFKMKK